MTTKPLWPHSSRLIAMMHAGTPLTPFLTEVANTARAMFGPDARAAVFLHDLEQACLNLGANGGMPEAYLAAIQGFRVGEHQPACGRAAFIGDEVIVPDLRLDARWAPYMDLAEESAIQACWSFPILSGTTVLGTLAVYHRVPKTPQSAETEALRYLATLAAAAIRPSATEGKSAAADLAPAGRRSGAGLETVASYLTASRAKQVPPQQPGSPAGP